MKITSKPAQIFIYSLFVIVLSGHLSQIFGQDTQATREVFSGDFKEGTKAGVSAQIVVNRRSGAKVTKSSVISPRKYALRRKTQRVAFSSKNSTNNSPKVNPGSKNASDKPDKNIDWEEIGFTIWKLRKKLPNEDSVSLSVIEKGLRVEYVPERAESDTLLKLGDKVRLTIESPRDGYLYVVDTEFYSDKTFGKPILIFPTQRTRGGNNRVSAGVLIDIPAQDDDVPFFVINSKNPVYAGELLSVIISSENLNNFSTPPQARSLEPDIIDEWTSNWGLEADVFEQEGGNGTKWTSAEKEAAQPNGRSLSQDDSTPQTIYRVRADKRKPVLVNLALSVSRN